MRLYRRRDAREARVIPQGLKPESVHLLTEYVLNMSMSSQGDNDVTPLYETYMNDSRLGDLEKQELMWVYMSLQLKLATHPEGS